MDTRSAARAAALTVPGLLLAGGGLMHPHLLTAQTAREWWTLHVALLPVFPLLPLALLWLLRGDDRVVAWAARIMGFGFAVGYTALDAVDGIGAGLVVDAAGAERPEITSRIFEIGDRIGRAGIWCLVATAVLTSVALWRRHAAWVLPGSVVFLIGCRLFYVHHIFRPVGVWAMLALAAGTALLAFAPQPSRRP